MELSHQLHCTFGSMGTVIVFSQGLDTTNTPILLPLEASLCFLASLSGSTMASGTVHPPHQYSVCSELQDKTNTHHHKASNIHSQSTYKLDIYSVFGVLSYHTYIPISTYVTTTGYLLPCTAVAELGECKCTPFGG